MQFAEHLKFLRKILLVVGLVAVLRRQHVCHVVFLSLYLCSGTVSKFSRNYYCQTHHFMKTGRFQHLHTCATSRYKVITTIKIKSDFWLNIEHVVPLKWYDMCVINLE